MISRAQRQFESGDYQLVVRSLSPAKKLTGDEATALICSLAFLGQHFEAVDYWKAYQESLTAIQQGRCRFALGVAFTRVSKLKVGRQFFRDNLRESKKVRALSAYAFQGAGFYLYFIGRFNEAHSFAKKASLAALKLKDNYVRFLAIDLLGHSEVQLGRRGEGLRLMKQAAKLALTYGNKNFAAAFDVASLIYEAEAGARPLTIERELRESLKDLSVQDSYTSGNLLLELARQLTLRGRWSEAKELLSTASSAIYNYSNRRQEFVLQVRLAELSFCQGEHFLTEHFIQAAKRCLNVVADKAFEVRLLGLEMKYLTEVNRKVPRALVDRLLDFSENHGSHINEQILYRQKLISSAKTSRQDDPLHQLFLKNLRNSDLAASEALELGYLGLWQRFKGLSSGAKYFVVLPDQQSFVLVTPSGNYLSEQSLSRQQLRILQSLQTGEKTKEELLREVWGYEYDPARHDSLMHSNVAKLRKAIEPVSHWIVTGEDGWAISSEVKWLLPKLSRISKAKPEVDSPGISLRDDNFTQVEDLNFRQIAALNELEKLGMWSISQYKSRFKVSTMTAFRDLTGLLESHLLVKTGRARATRYHLAQSKTQQLGSKL